MKTTILSGLLLIIISLSSAGQSIDKQMPAIKPADSVTVKSGTVHIGFPGNNDSSKFKVKNFSPLTKKGDLLVFNPGASLDRMPNAVVTTPGVHYHLKIIPNKMVLENKQLLPWEYKLPPLQPLQPFEKKLQPWKNDLPLNLR